ncbi:MAG: roadblock/LC7 domain-containing protein [Promethearchaeota archaeon]|jgi:predicted regulator of Ras-like GTPase activity (Roadblock/LC7/MglB family)
MNSDINTILKNAIKKIYSIMHEQSVNELTIQRQYLPEIIDTNLLEIHDGLPALKPFVENAFRLNRIRVNISTKEIRFKVPSVENLDDTIKPLLSATPEVRAAAIVSTEGLPIASALPQGVDETKVAAMTAALLSLAERSIIELKNGEFDQLYIKGSEGYLLVLQAGPNAVLTVATTSDVRLGLIFLDCKRTCDKIAKLI